MTDLLVHRRKLVLPIKSFLYSHRALQDCKFAIDDLKNADRIVLSNWRTTWAGICSLLKASIHLMGTRDCRACFPTTLRDSLKAAWQELGRDKVAYPLFWQFINRERNNILKQYDFSAYAALIKEDGTYQSDYSLLGMLQTEKSALLIRGGQYHGQEAIPLASSAASWVEDYIFNAVQRGGFNPETVVDSREFLSGNR